MPGLPLRTNIKGNKIHPMWSSKQLQTFSGWRVRVPPQRFHSSTIWLQISRQLQLCSADSERRNSNFGKRRLTLDFSHPIRLVLCTFNYLSDNSNLLYLPANVIASQIVRDGAYIERIFAATLFVGQKVSGFWRVPTISYQSIFIVSTPDDFAAILQHAKKAKAWARTTFVCSFYSTRHLL